GAVVREAKGSTDPDPIASWLHESGYSASKLGFEAGALSTGPFHELTTGGWDVVCPETRQVHQVLKAYRDKTDRGDAVEDCAAPTGGRPHGSRALLQGVWGTGPHPSGSRESHSRPAEAVWHPAPPRGSPPPRRSCAHKLCSAAGAGGRHGGASTSARAGHG